MNRNEIINYDEDNDFSSLEDNHDLQDEENLLIKHVDINFLLGIEDSIKTKELDQNLISTIEFVEKKCESWDHKETEPWDEFDTLDVSSIKEHDKSVAIEDSNNVELCLEEEKNDQSKHEKMDTIENMREMNMTNIGILVINAKNMIDQTMRLRIV